MTRRQTRHAHEPEDLVAQPELVEETAPPAAPVAPTPLPDETLRLVGELLGAVESYLGANARQGPARYAALSPAAKALRDHLGATA